MNLRQQLAHDLAEKIPGAAASTKFGHGSLHMGDDRIFAFTRPDESAALKLPEARIIELTQADGEITPLTMGKRTMREWVVIPNIAAPENLKLLHEAKAYVASLPSKEKKSATSKTAKKAAKKTAARTPAKKTSKR
jgi:hypothetical protein